MRTWLCYSSTIDFWETAGRPECEETPGNIHESALTRWQVHFQVWPGAGRVEGRLILEPTWQLFVWAIHNNILRVWFPRSSAPSSKSKTCTEVDPLHNLWVMLALYKALAVLNKHNRLLSDGRSWKVLMPWSTKNWPGLAESHSLFPIRRNSRKHLWVFLDTVTKRCPSLACGRLSWWENGFLRPTDGSSYKWFTLTCRGYDECFEIW